MRSLVVVIVLCCLLVPTHARACIWDRDTLAMERARFPEVNELIVGYFARHAPVYYQWRADQVLKVPIAKRTPADFDDLAASFDKLGQHSPAIETMLAKVERFPSEGVYETHANLGTFYIHAGELERGLDHIATAIQINPDAHFGREVYQKLLVEYVLERRAAGATLPLHDPDTDRNFATYVIERQRLSETDPLHPDDADAVARETGRAIKGVLGMMRFGRFDSPILLEALGDLLLYGDAVNDEQRLAARAYLKASYEVDDPQAADAYRVLADRAMQSQENTNLQSVEADLRDEIQKADAFFAQIEADEARWAASGKDLDAEFQRVYYAAPTLQTPARTWVTDTVRTLSPMQQGALALLDVVLLAVIGGLIWAYRHHRRATSAKPSA